MRSPLLPPPGIVSDDTTFATPGAWADGNNMRFERAKPQTIGGWSDALGGALTGVCRNVLTWTDNAGYLNLAFGTHSALMVYKDGALSNITPVGLAAGAEHGAGGPGYSAGGYGDDLYGEGSTDDYFPRTWSLSNFGQLLMASPRYGTLYVWENVAANVATVVTNAPDNINFMLVTDTRQVMAFGCNEEVSGDFNGLAIRWSTTEDYTDWTTAPDNLAGEYILKGAGRIVGARQLGTNIAIWTDNALYLAQFTGDALQPWIFDAVAGNCGLVGPNGVQIINQTAYWISPDYQFHVWQPGVQPVRLACPIRNDFKDNLAAGQFDKICATSVSQYGEVWWFYPDARDGLENSRYLALSTEAGTWFRGQMARSAATDAGPTQYPLFVDPNGSAYWHENGNTANGDVLSWSITTSDQYISEAAQFLLIRGLWPDFEDQRGPATMTLSLRKYPQAEAVTKGPYNLSVGLEKRDFLCSGRVAAVTFEGSSSPAFVRFGKPMFDVVPTGQQ